MERPGTVVPEEGLTLDHLEHRSFFFLTDQQSARPSRQQRGVAHRCAAVDCQPIGNGHLNVSSGVCCALPSPVVLRLLPSCWRAPREEFREGAGPWWWRTPAAGRWTTEHLTLS